MKFAVVLALAGSATAAYVDVYSNTPLKSLLFPRCLVRGSYNEVNLGWCLVEATISFHFKNGYLRTNDDNCLMSTDPKEGATLLLGKCKNAKGCKWAQTGKNQWRNEYNLCLEATTATGKLVQKKCTPQTYQYYQPNQEFQLQTKVKKNTCKEWLPKYGCGKGKKPIKNVAKICDGLTCLKQCCEPNTCAEWKGKCPSGKKPAKNAAKKICDGLTCLKQCCEPHTCAEWKGQCSYGNYLIPNPGEKACDYGYGSPTCSSECCKTYQEVVMKTCNVWANGGKQYGYTTLAQKCDLAYKMLPKEYINPDIEQCNVKAYYKFADSCLNKCCTPRKKAY